MSIYGEDHSELGDSDYPEWREVLKALLMRGFILENTGGNCEAFIRYGSSGQVWITGGEEPTIPRGFNTPVTVGFYANDSTGEPIAYIQFETLTAALRALSDVDSIHDELKERILFAAHEMQILLPPNLIRGL